MYNFYYTFAVDLNTVRTYYRVADLLFAVETNATVAWGTMPNYAAFREEEVAGLDESPLFVLRIDSTGLLGEAEQAVYRHLYTDSSEEDMPRIEVYQRADGGWWLRVAIQAKAPICCELVCDAHFNSAVLHLDTDCADRRFCIDNALMLLYAFRTAPLRVLEMHAAVVVKPRIATNGGGRELAYLFLGHSGTGKSTHARQWLEAYPDAWLLNDDNPIVRVMPDGEVRVYGSPWSGKTPCYKNAYARIGGIIKLSQAPYNQMQSVSLPQAYAYMLSSTSGLKMEPSIADSLHESIKHIITHVPCRHMHCLPNTEAARVCYETLNQENV